ncbi:MAG: hypothetical protein K0R34_2164 [Herbinix sp.]|jgi:hypothetical protein|nr:hypothetical protein [Herbinix sp.]
MSAYAGYLLKINGTVLPNKYILMDSYNSTPHQQSDIDSYEDGNGLLHRTVAPHTRSKPDFNTVPKLALAEKMALQEIIPTSATERIRLTVEYWDDDTNTYQTGDFYVPDITYPIHDAGATDIIYNSIRIAFIEY